LEEWPLSRGCIKLNAQTFTPDYINPVGALQIPNQQFLHTKQPQQILGVGGFSRPSYSHRIPPNTIHRERMTQIGKMRWLQEAETESWSYFSLPYLHKSRMPNHIVQPSRR
jgi:hypothetical protein